MTSASFAILEPVGNAHIALESVDIQACLRGLMSEVVVTQEYRNTENSNIEAVYTFPLPLDAVLLDLTLELNGKTLSGVVTSKPDASQQYEEAIEEGDSAVLLSKIEPGLFTINVGNILPGEQAIIKFKYAQLHQWSGDSLRLVFPSTLAPRYGNPLTNGLEIHEVPEFVLTADYRISVNIRIEGELAAADLDCPSHPVAISVRDEVANLSLSGGSALMDRDFVLIVRQQSDAAIRVLCEKDTDGYVALASFRPLLPDVAAVSARCLKLVIDCSGSMGGDSIAQAKEALHEILALLRPCDYFNVVTFGSSFNLLFPEPVLASEKNIKTAAHFVQQIDANMGGTEIEAALQAAYASTTDEPVQSDLLLITDGNVWNSEQIIVAATNSGHRIFSVGVGSAVSEALVRGIAKATSAACELVSPRENMSEGIVRHFKRINQARASSVDVRWSHEPIRQIPADIESVYAGDTLHVFAWFHELPNGPVELSMTFEDGRKFHQQLQFANELNNSDHLSTSLSRVAASARLASLSPTNAEQLAEQYQLVTDYTSCVLVMNREDYQKSEDIPALRKVPQVLAAGWGGLGSSNNTLRVSASRSMSKQVPKVFYSAKMSNSNGAASNKESTLFLDMPVFLRRQATTNFEVLVKSLNRLYANTTAAHLEITTISELVHLGLPQEHADKLKQQVSAECSELSVVVSFLVELAEGHEGEGMSRHLRRVIRKAAAKHLNSELLTTPCAT